VTTRIAIIFVIRETKKTEAKKKSDQLKKINPTVVCCWVSLPIALCPSGGDLRIQTTGREETKWASPLPKGSVGPVGAA
jgi:hypothetical protein